jgi:hypothetical protein
LFLTHPQQRALVGFAVSLQMAFRKYAYKPLDENDREFRLVHLHPSGQFSSQVRCSILTTTLDNAPEYTALSYCWGDASNRLTIELNDASFLTPPNSYLSTTSNLYLALQQLRQTYHVRPLWIDAICINQDDSAERSSQVRLMRDIYERAEKTIVWLGEAADNSELAIDLIKAWADASEDFDAFLRHCSFAFEEKNWEAVKKLFERPWWTRVWVYQEFVVSKQVFFLCGSESMSSQVFRSARSSWTWFCSSSAINKVDRKKALIVQAAEFGSIDQLDWQRILYELRRTRIRRNQSYDDIPRMDLLALLSFTSHLEATDPKDKLYALLGVDDVRDVTVIPNYSHSVSQVYTDFAVNYIETRLSLEILGEAGIGFTEQNLELPSWAPDPRKLVMKGQNLTNKINCASGNYKRVPLVDSTQSLLSVMGFVCDIVTIFGSSETQWVLRHEQWADIALNSPCTHPTGISRLQAFFRTMTADQTGYGFGRPEFNDEKEQMKFLQLVKSFMIFSGITSQKYYRQSPALLEKYQRWQDSVAENSRYVAYLQLFLKLISDEPVVKTDSELLEPFVKSTSQYGQLELQQSSADLTEDEERNLAFQYVNHAAQATKRKTFFVTEKGYMGLGPAMIKNGDKVCILFGCQHPLLLRKIGEVSRLVGEIYVYGMMRGEMIEKFEAGIFTEEKFVIR